MVGVGGNDGVTITFSADVTTVLACLSMGGNIPNDPNRQEVCGNVSVTDVFTSDKDGNVVATFAVSAPRAPDRKESRFKRQARRAALIFRSERTDTNHTSKSDLITNKEVLVLVGIVIFGVLLIGLAIILGKEASGRVLASAIPWAITAALLGILTLPWWVRQDAKRIERRHIRESHSSDPKP